MGSRVLLVDNGNIESKVNVCQISDLLKLVW